MSEAKDLLLANLSWPELQELKDEIRFVLVPVGSFEQHGPNMSLITDTALVSEVCRRASQELYPQVLVAPTVPWGISYHHMHFPGTITMHHDTLHKVLRDIVKSLYAHGFEKFMLVNGHGGNTNLVAEAAVRIREELGVPFIASCNYFSMGLPIGVGHAGKVEVSYGLYLAPETVKVKSLTDGEMTEFCSKAKGVHCQYPMRKRTVNGPIGEVAGASAEYGKELAEAAIKGLVDALKTLIAEDNTLDAP